MANINEYIQLKMYSDRILKNSKFAIPETRNGG
jgi:hypothetical protein